MPIIAEVTWITQIAEKLEEECSRLRNSRFKSLRREDICILWRI
jgi:hypothetical protein